MYRKLVILMWIVILSLPMLVPAKQAEATIGAIATTCKVYDKFGYTVSAANHPNGLIYIAMSDSQSNSADSLRTKARIVIRAIDPESARNGTCVSTQYSDSITYTTYSVVVTPTVIRSDSNGNLYIGKINQGGYRLLYIPSSATKSNPFAGVKASTISGVPGGPFVSMGGMAVTTNHVLVGAATFEPGKKFFSYYRVITTAQAAQGANINGGWQSLSGYPLYGPQYSAVDSFAGMSNGNFFIGGSFEYSNPKFMALGGILNPTTGRITGVKGTSGQLDPLPCTTAALGLAPFGCFYPTGQMGDDGKLYVSYGAGQINGPRHSYIVRYNLQANRWENLNNAPNVPSRITPLSGRDASGLGMYIDANGKIYAAGTNGVKGPLTLAAYENGVWKDAGFNIPAVEFSKPAVVMSTFGSENRLSVFYVSLLENGHVYWTTFKGAFSGAATSCSERMSIENGATAVNSTSVVGVLTVGNSCGATKYVARVSATNRAPTTAVLAREYVSYARTNPIISVSGLAANQTNFIHVRLFNSSNRPVSNWITQQIIVDTASTVGVTTALTNSFTSTGFQDTPNNGASYTHPDYTRSLIGKFTISAVTDTSGLRTFQFSGSNERTYSSALLNQEQTVFLQLLSPTSAGTTVRLVDGAGNIEDRAMTLIYDATPPVATGATISQTSTDDDSFTRTFSVGGTAVTDTQYPGGYWGVWVAIEKDTGSADATRSTLKWGAVPVTSGSFSVNLLSGSSGGISSGTYRVYVRFLDGAGNASTDVTDTTVSVTYTDSDFEVFAPYITIDR